MIIHTNATPTVNSITTKVRRRQTSCRRYRYLFTPFSCLRNKSIQQVSFTRSSRTSQQRRPTAQQNSQR